MTAFFCIPTRFVGLVTVQGIGLLLSGIPVIGWIMMLCEV